MQETEKEHTMGEIRSALDIALEKTANIQGDTASADNRELKNKGKKTAGDYLATGDASSLAGLIAGLSPDKAKTATEGSLSILLAAIHLPSAEADLAKIDRIGAGIDTLLSGAGMAQLFDQVAQILKQYLDERDHLSKALEQQFMPKLRAKQQELAKRYGQNIPININQDPEYAATLSKNVRMLEQKYDAVIDEVRARVRETAGISED
jgi:hypothetical protein